MKSVRRTWREVRVVRQAGGFAVQLDCKPLSLPSGTALVLTTRELAEAVAAEWLSQGEGEVIRMDDIPLTRLAGTAQERITPDPGPTRAALAAYGRSDLLCYRAAAPEALIRREEALWQPWLDWAAKELNAPLKATRGVMPLRQDPESLAALDRALERSDVPVLAALGVAVPALGSLVLGLALAAARLSAADAIAAAFADEIFQAGIWGEDRVAAAKRAAIGAEVHLAERYLALAR